jgi:hypothetical protein
MSRQLLVPIKGRDRIEDLLPYLEDLARPGMKIVFLVHFGVNRFADLAGQLLEIQGGLPTKFTADSVVPQANFTRRVERASQVLRRRGVRIEVKFYSGRWLSILRECQEADTHRLIVMRPGQPQVWRWLRNLFSKLQFTRTSPAMPVLLFHPSKVSRRPL